MSNSLFIAFHNLERKNIERSQEAVENYSKNGVI